MFACRDCIRETTDFDMLAEVMPTTELDSKTFALCGSCAIHYHVARGHETIPFFNLLSDLQLPKHLANVTLLRKEFDEKVNKVYEFHEQIGVAMTAFNQVIKYFLTVISQNSIINSIFLPSII
uniref:Uncharacterized protein n=1 Tax=Caenorhabditis japonica TaxID=281687 RepID=A0A8R1E5N1_CAEJA